MIALCPKCYTSWNGNDATNRKMSKAIKCKGASLKQNPMTSQNYVDILMSDSIKKQTFNGRNINLMLKSKHSQLGEMYKITVNKCVLSGKHTKGVAQANGCVYPFLI